jgi:hypothetical protein
MGQRKGEQGQLFYAFDLEAVVPDDHLVGGLRQFSISRGCASSLRRITPILVDRRSIQS